MPPHVQTIEYALSVTNTKPASGWVAATGIGFEYTFTGLDSARTYYIFARSLIDDLDSDALQATTDGSGTFAITFEDLSENDPVITDGVTLKKSESDTATVTAPTGFNSWFWYVNGEEKSTANSITINALDLALADHYVTLIVSDGTRTYSAVVIVRVEE